MKKLLIIIAFFANLPTFSQNKVAQLDSFFTTESGSLKVKEARKQLQLFVLL